MLKFILILSILFTGCIFDEEERDEPNYATYGTATVYFNQGAANIDLKFEPGHSLYLKFDDEYNHFDGIYDYGTEGNRTWQGLIIRNDEIHGDETAGEVDITDLYYMNSKYF